MTRKAMFVFLCIPFRIELHTLSMEYLPTKLAMVLVCILYIVFVQNWIAYLFRFYEMNKNENISDWAFCVVAVNGTWIGISCVMFTRTKTSSSEFQTCLLFGFPSSALPPSPKKRHFDMMLSVYTKFHSRWNDPSGEIIFCLWMWMFNPLYFGQLIHLTISKSTSCSIITLYLYVIKS